MEEHFIYARPVVVTEDKIKEALAKQANQRALKAALDQQILESERLKAEAHRAKGKKDKKSVGRGDGVSTASSGRLDEGGCQKNSHSAGAGPGPSPPPLPSSMPVNSNGSGTHAGPSTAIEPTRYTFLFKEGQGTFEMTDSSVRPLKDTLQPSSAECRARVGSGDGGGSAVPANVKDKKHNAPLPAKRSSSSRDSARATSGNGVSSSGSNRSKRKVSPGAAAAAGGEYQTNSLPVNFRLGKDAGTRASGASRERSRGAARGTVSGGGTGSNNNSSSGSGGGGYDTQSLPVELIYKLSQGGALLNTAAAAAANGNMRSPSRLNPPHPSKLASPPKRSPSMSRNSDSVEPRSPMSAQPVPPRSPGSVVRERSVPLSPRPEDRAGNGAAGRPPVSPRCGKSGQLNTPLDGAAGVRRSARPAGGILPPLNGRHDSDVIEMSAVLDVRTPVGDNNSGSNGVSGSNGASRRRTSSMPHDRSSLPPGAAPPTSDAITAERARKQAEREKGWAQQVKQLKAELRKARQRAEGRATNGKVDEALVKAPRRAETAPDPPVYPPGKAPRGGIGVLRQRRAERGNSSFEHAGPAWPTRLEKMDFSKAHIFSRDTFRPITAPEDAASYFGNVLGSPGAAAAPRTPLPLMQPKTSPPPIPSVAAAKKAEATASPAESDLHVQKATTQGSSHTATSEEESLKLASLTTRQVTLGLPNFGDGEPVPIQFLHLQQFVEAQIITANQAENLWEFFALSVLPEFGGGGGGDGHARFSGEASAFEDGEGDYELQRPQGQQYHYGEPEEMDSNVIDVQEMPCEGALRSPRHMANSGQGDGDDDHGDEDEYVSEGTDGEKEGGDQRDEVAFFVPPSFSQPPINAVLAPALRRKISQLHSEEAALLLQHHHQFRSGRARPGVVADAKPKRGAAKKEAPLSPCRDSDASEPEGTFDTYSELKLSLNVTPAAGGEEEELQT